MKTWGILLLLLFCFALGVSQITWCKKKKFFLIKERFRLTENWQSARCSQGKFDLCSCSQKLTHCLHARKFSQRPGHYARHPLEPLPQALSLVPLRIHILWSSGFPWKSEKRWRSCVTFCVVCSNQDGITLGKFVDSFFIDRPPLLFITYS